MSIELSSSQVSPEQLAQNTEIDRISQELQRETQSRISDPKLQKLSQKFLLQVDLALHQNPENKSVIQAYQDNLDALEKLESFSSTA